MYTPSTDQIRAVWHQFYNIPAIPERRVALDAELDRWLESVRREAKSEMLNEVADSIEGETFGEMTLAQFDEYTNEHTQQTAGQAYRDAIDYLRRWAKALVRS